MIANSSEWHRVHSMLRLRPGTPRDSKFISNLKSLQILSLKIDLLHLPTAYSSQKSPRPKFHCVRLHSRHHRSLYTTYLLVKIVSEATQIGQGANTERLQSNVKNLRWRIYKNLKAFCRKIVQKSREKSRAESAGPYYSFSIRGLEISGVAVRNSLDKGQFTVTEI